MLSPLQMHRTPARVRYAQGGEAGGDLCTHKCFREERLRGAGEDVQLDEAEPGHAQQQEDATQHGKEDPGKACQEVTTG